MNGRLEHSIRTNNNIKNILQDLPDYFTEYYYSIISSSEPKTCEDYIRFESSVNSQTSPKFLQQL